MDVAEIHVLIVDDHSVVRKSMRALFAQVPNIHVVGEAGSGEEAVALVQALQPDVILMDLIMPGMDGIEAIRRVTTSRPSSRVLVLTGFSVEDKAFAAMRAGALGYLHKDLEAAELIRAIEQVHRGEVILHPTIAGQEA